MANLNGKVENSQHNREYASKTANIPDASLIIGCRFASFDRFWSALSASAFDFDFVSSSKFDATAFCRGFPGRTFIVRTGADFSPVIDVSPAFLLRCLGVASAENVTILFFKVIKSFLALTLAIPRGGESKYDGKIM